MSTLPEQAHSGLPSWFRGRCAEASYGGHDGYRRVGRQLMRCILRGGEQPWGISPQEFESWLVVFRRLLVGDHPHDELTKDQSFMIWREFRALYPRFAAQIPGRRRSAFITGMRDSSMEE